MERNIGKFISAEYKILLALLQKQGIHLKPSFEGEFKAIKSVALFFRIDIEVNANRGQNAKVISEKQVTAGLDAAQPAED